MFLLDSFNGTDGMASVRLSSSLADVGAVSVSVCVFSSLCQYYNVKEGRWRSDGLQALEGSTLHTAHCLTRHLTMFGASLLVHPGAVVLLPPVRLNKRRNYVITYSKNVIISKKIYLIIAPPVH